MRFFALFYVEDLKVVNRISIGLVNKMTKVKTRPGVIKFFQLINLLAIPSYEKGRAPA